MMDRFSCMDSRFEPMVLMICFDCCISEHDRCIFSSNVIGLIENKLFSETQPIIVTLLLNNHVIMAHSDNESDLPLSPLRLHLTSSKGSRYPQTNLQSIHEMYQVDEGVVFKVSRKK